MSFPGTFLASLNAGQALMPGTTEEETMADVETYVAVYTDVLKAENDWAALGSAAQANEIKLADGALVENRDGEAVIMERQEHHGWGKGAIVGAVVGIIFPPSIIASAAVGAGGGALISRMMRRLGRGKVMELGSTFDSGTWAIIVAYPAEFKDAVAAKLQGAKTSWTAVSATDEEVEEAVAALLSLSAVVNVAPLQLRRGFRDCARSPPGRSPRGCSLPELFLSLVRRLVPHQLLLLFRDEALSSSLKAHPGHNGRNRHDPGHHEEHGAGGVGKVEPDEVWDRPTCPAWDSESGRLAWRPVAAAHLVRSASQLRGCAIGRPGLCPGSPDPRLAA